MRRGDWRAAWIECRPDRWELHVAQRRCGERTATTTVVGAADIGGAIRWARGLGTGRHLVLVRVRDEDGPSVGLATALRAAGLRVVVSWPELRLVGPPACVNGVRFELSLRGYGWLRARLVVADREVVLPGSYMSDPWTGTAAALERLHQGSVQEAVGWIEEPGSFLLVLTRRPAGELLVQVHYDSDEWWSPPPAAPPAGVPVFAATTSFAGFTGAFVGAGRAFLDAHGSEMIARLWDHPPPAAALDRLAAVIGRE